MKLGILNTTITTNNGVYEVHPITVEQAIAYVKESVEHGEGFSSHVGHDATAAVLTNLLGFNIPMCRDPFSQQPNQAAIVMKMKGRIAEGQIIKTNEELDAIGYDLKLMVRLPDSCYQSCSLRNLFVL